MANGINGGGFFQPFVIRPVSLIGPLTSIHEAYESQALPLVSPDVHGPTLIMPAETIVEFLKNNPSNYSGWILGTLISFATH